MKINWKARIKNKVFWISLITLVAALVAEVWGFFGPVPNLNPIVERLIEIVKIIFMILGVLGVVNDPTTEGWSDSKLAMTYDKPKPKEA